MSAIDHEKLGVFYLGHEVDPATGQTTSEPILYDARDLTTHAVVVGMTGSGKTGLCISLLEEAAIDGIPAIVIDPKGDIANLLLTFPDLRPQDFAPWVDADEARRQDLTVEALAAKTATRWREGLAATGQSPERIRRLQSGAEVVVHTPGGTAGLGLSVLRSFAPPAGGMGDGEAVRDRIGALVGGLLGLLQRDADPLTSRDYLLLSALIEQAWTEGREPDLAQLIQAVQRPGIAQLGVFDLETFFPAKDRLQLAMALNGLLVSPSFKAWREGEPLDIARLLHTPAGRPRISILSIAHLDDAERMFVVSLVLNEMVAWMRTQGGTSSLRALLYMDEVAGYFPPNGSPPSKPPMLLLLKQARAFGLGVVLATQNPVDLDYKALGNTGTWFIGRLQTERDKARVREGLESALGGALTGEQLDRWLSSLSERAFLMRNVHDEAPVLMRARWALSFLRGPLAGPEIARLMAANKEQAAAVVPRPELRVVGAAPHPSPVVAVGGIAEGPAPDDGLEYEPYVRAVLKLHYVDAKTRIDNWETRTLLAPLSPDGTEALWAEALEGEQTAAGWVLDGTAEAATAQTLLPPGARSPKALTSYGKQLTAHAYEHCASTLLVCDALKLNSAPGESAGAFQARLQLAAREARDAALDELRRKYAAKLQTAQDQLRRAEARHERETEQASQQTLNAAVSIGATLLGALFGGGTRRRRSGYGGYGTVGRASTAARSASRAYSERGDVARAAETVEVERQQLAELESALQADMAEVSAGFDPTRLVLREVRLAPRKSDLAVGRVEWVWRRYRRGTDGFREPA